MRWLDRFYPELDCNTAMAEQWTPGAVAALREKENLPFVRADANGNIVEFNARFAVVYGWSEQQLVGESISAILPPSFREFHHAGFARFQLTESSKVVGHPLTLATVCSVMAAKCKASTTSLRRSTPMAVGALLPRCGRLRVTMPRSRDE